MIRFRKDLIPCKPPENRSVQYEMRSGVRTVSNILRLTPVEVVLENQHFPVGQKVYITGDLAKSDQRVYAHDVDGKDVPFILVDLGQIYAVEDESEPTLSDEEADAYLKNVDRSSQP